MSTHALDEECGSCPEFRAGTQETPEDICANAQRECGHHCNHVWTNDRCHWCGMEYGEEGAVTWGQGSLPLTEEPNPLARKPTGMCGSPKKCAACPSDFLCSMRASAQAKLIREREASRG